MKELLPSKQEIAPVESDRIFDAEVLPAAEELLKKLFPSFDSRRSGAGNLIDRFALDVLGERGVEGAPIFHRFLPSNQKDRIARAGGVSEIFQPDGLSEKLIDFYKHRIPKE
jgi:hypothetical protein